MIVLMKIDFLLIATWSEMNQKQMVLWAREFADRGYTTALLYPGEPKASPPSDVDSFTLDNTAEISATPTQAEHTYGIPSIDHLAFTERQMFSLGREEARQRAMSLLATMETVFQNHSVEYSLQIRGPEMHRLLTHYYVNEQSGTSLWADFSPFDGTFALQTTLGGVWDTYRTIPYDEISETDRERVRDHIESFRDEKKFYAHDDNESTEARQSLLTSTVSTLRQLATRQRPGRIQNQIINELKLRGQATINRQLYPSVSESQRLCKQTEYVFFPLQYPIESRLTVFSPQFYRQEFLVEYLSRILPSSVELFVKGHPNHPGRPSPATILNYSRSDNVTFLHPSVNAHDVIRDSVGVVVTNNTVGFETLYYQKPLFVLGTGFYSATPAAINVTDLGDLPTILADHVRTTVPERDIVASIHSLREASYEGSRPDFDTENVATIVDSVLQFLENSDE
jgi:hypothetical protein